MTQEQHPQSLTRARSLSQEAFSLSPILLKAFLRCVMMMAATGPLKAQQKDAIKQISFIKSTRGYEERIRVTPDSVVMRVEDFRADEKVKQSRRKLSKGEWRTLLKSLKNVPLESIPDLPSPGQQRASDAALQGTLEIVTTQQHAYTHTFDNEDPNAKLLPLLKGIKALASSGKHR